MPGRAWCARVHDERARARTRTGLPAAAKPNARGWGLPVLLREVTRALPPDRFPVRRRRRGPAAGRMLRFARRGVDARRERLGRRGTVPERARRRPGPRRSRRVGRLPVEGQRHPPRRVQPHRPAAHDPRRGHGPAGEGRRRPQGELHADRHRLRRRPAPDARHRAERHGHAHLVAADLRRRPRVRPPRVAHRLVVPRRHARRGLARLRARRRLHLRAADPRRGHRGRSRRRHARGDVRRQRRPHHHDADGKQMLPQPTAPAPTEVRIENLRQGAGEVVNPGDQVIVQYTGALYDSGQVFDSSWQRGPRPSSSPTRSSTGSARRSRGRRSARRSSSSSRPPRATATRPRATSPRTRPCSSSSTSSGSSTPTWRAK